MALMLALLELLTLEERTVAIDTAGTHTDVVEKIQSQGGAFRAHREGLPEESSAVIGHWFSAYRGSAVSADAQVGAGGLQKISREYPHRGPHYITDLPDPKRINGAIRRHWGGRE